MRALQTGGGGVSIRASPCEHLSLMQRHVCTLPLQRRTTGSVLCLIQQTQSLEHAVSWPAEKNCCWWWRSWVWGVSSLLSFALFALQELYRVRGNWKNSWGSEGSHSREWRCSVVTGFVSVPVQLHLTEECQGYLPSPMHSGSSCWQWMRSGAAAECWCYPVCLPFFPSWCFQIALTAAEHTKARVNRFQQKSQSKEVLCKGL